MSQPVANFSYDLFISYSHADKAWVQEWLAPRLKAAGVSLCTDSESFDIGVPALINMERAAAASRHTLLVLSPDWVASPWTTYESLLSQSEDPGGLLQRTLPVLYRPCPLPPRLRMLTYADLSGAGDTEAEFARLLDAIHGVRRLPAVGEGPAAARPSPAPPAMAPGGRSGGISIGSIQAETVNVAEIMTVDMRRNAAGPGAPTPGAALAPLAPLLSLRPRQGAGRNAVILDEEALTCRVQLSYTLEVRRACSLLQLDFSAPAGVAMELPDRRRISLDGETLVFGPDLRLRSTPTLLPGSHDLFHAKVWRFAAGHIPGAEAELVLQIETAEAGQTGVGTWITRLRLLEDGRVQGEETAVDLAVDLRQQLANRQALLRKLQEEHILASGRERAALAVHIEQEQAAITALQAQLDAFGGFFDTDLY